MARVMLDQFPETIDYGFKESTQFVHVYGLTEREFDAKLDYNPIRIGVAIDALTDHVEDMIGKIVLSVRFEGGV